MASGHTDVQWAPFMSDLPKDENEWVMVGQMDGNDATTKCLPYDCKGLSY